MNSYAYYNGSFGKKDEISIPLQDRSIYFGDAIYDAAIGSYDRIMWEDEHINRFLLNAKRLGITHSYTRSFLSSLLREIGIKSMLSSYFIYFQMSRSLPNRIHSAKDAKANLLVTIDPITIEQSPSSLSLITLPDKRYDYCHIKTVNLIPSVLASTKAEKAGADEAIFVRGRYVTECAKSNISILNQGRIITHPKNNKILPGIAREHLLQICEQLNVTFIERPFSVYEMMNADEVLVTSTTKLCRRVSKINGIQVGGGSPDLAHNLCLHMFFEYKKECKV